MCYKKLLSFPGLNLSANPNLSHPFIYAIEIDIEIISLLLDYWETKTDQDDDDFALMDAIEYAKKSRNPRIINLFMTHPVTKDYKW